MATEENLPQETKKKRAVRKKKVTPNAEPSVVHEAPPLSRSRDSRPASSGGNVLVLLFVIVLLAILGMYIFQKQQSDSLESNISTHTQTFEGKFSELKEKLAETEQRVAEEKEQATKNADKKMFVSPLFDYSFSYPALYEVLEVQSHISETFQEVAVFVRTSEKPPLDDLPREGGPMITFEVHSNPDTLALEEWGRANAQSSHLSDDVVPEQRTVGDVDALRYDWQGELYEYNTSVLFSLGEHVVLATAMYIDSADVIPEDFQAMIDSLIF